MLFIHFYTYFAIRVSFLQYQLSTFLQLYTDGNKEIIFQKRYYQNFLCINYMREWARFKDIANFWLKLKFGRCLLLEISETEILITFKKKIWTQVWIAMLSFSTSIKQFFLRYIFQNFWFLINFYVWFKDAVFEGPFLQRFF